MYKCFEKCGDKADKSDKVVECQAECVSDSAASGRSRSSMGPSGEYSRYLMVGCTIIYMYVA